MFKKIGEYLKKTFKSTEGFIKKYVAPAILAVEALKLMVDGPIGECVKRLLPKDASKVAEFSQRLSMVLDMLGLTNDIAAADSLEGKLWQLQKWMQTNGKPARDAVLFKIAALLAKNAASEDGLKISGTAIEMLVMVDYTNRKNKLGESYGAEVPVGKPVPSKAES